MSLESLLAELNAHQVSAATIDRHHALVLAGAGCGKTKTIVARAAYLIANGTPPQRIQILTFTRRSASEIVERVQMHLGDSSEGLKASTFHTWCISLMRRAPDVFGCKGYSVIDRDDQLQLFKRLRGQNDRSGLPTAATLCDVYSYARNTGATLDTTLKLKAPEAYEQKQNIGVAVRGYEQKKRERRYLDYDDILDMVAQALAQSPEVCGWVAKQYDHILIDEMQDTNPLQWKLIDPLRYSVTLFCVGDDAQSIYGFRGADFRNVHSFSERVPNSATLRLEQNYRSTQEILDAANWLLGESPLTYDKHLEAVRGAGIRPRLHTFHNEWAEARWIAEDLTARRAEGADWKEHMILVRSSFSAKTLESALIARNIPYRFIGGTKLMETAHVRDVLSLLRIVGNPRDEIAWMRFMTLWPGIGEASANKLVEQMLQLETVEDCLKSLDGSKLPAAALRAIRTVYTLQSEVKKALSMALAGLETLLASRYRSQQWDTRKRDFKLVERLAEKHTSILGFIEDYLLDPVHASALKIRETEDTVTIITIHSAKGTEKGVCYVLNVSPGAYPSTYAVGDEDKTEEERRVLYVALTRAKNELIVTRQGQSQWAYQKTSGRTVSVGEGAPNYFFNLLPDGIFDEEYHVEEGPLVGGRPSGATGAPNVGIILGFSPEDSPVASTNFFRDNGDGTVTDQRTGLTWLRFSLGQTWDGEAVLGKAWTYLWESAMQLKYEFAGFDDWRLPTVKELQSIVAKSRLYPTIDLNAFPNTQAQEFWSASHLSKHEEYKYQVSFSDGFEGCRSANQANAVRLVRGNYAPDAPKQPFKDHGNGTVTDIRSGIMWMRCALGQTWNSDVLVDIGAPRLMPWDDAMALTHSFAGYHDWRLPDVDELESICVGAAPTVEGGAEAFRCIGSMFWSSTPYKDTSAYLASMHSDAFPTGKEYPCAVILARHG